MRTKIKPISLFVPFETIERRAEDDALIVKGYAFCNEVVPGEGRVRLKRSAMVAATAGYMQNGGGVVREMHGPFAAGIAHTAEWDDRGCLLTAEIVDPVAKLKVERKVYRGFSVGVNPKVVDPDGGVDVADWPETSLVDRPKDPDALFLHRTADFDPEQEVEVEVLDAPASPAAAADPPDAAAPSDRVPSLVPPSSPDPSGEVTPSAAAPLPASAEGGSSSTEGETPDLSVMRAALVRSGTPEEMLDQLDIAASYQALVPEQRAETWTAGGTAGTWTATSAVLVPQEPVERAQTTETVPIRENLEGPAKGTVPKPVGMPPPPKPGTGYPPPATKPPAIPPGMMPKKMRGYVGVLPDGCWGLFRSMEDETVVGVFLDLGDAIEALRRHADPLERVIKHEDGKWCVYSESGKKLGEHDTEEQAKKQLQAIEIEKHKDEPDATQPRDEKKRAADIGLPRFGLAEIEGEFAVFDRERETFQRFATREEADARCLEIAAAAVEEPPPAAPETVSRSSDREEAAALLAREDLNAEVVRVRTGTEEALQRLAAVEARLQRVEGAPLAKPIFRSQPKPEALSREFLQNLGREEDQELERMKAAYPDAKAAAVAEARMSDGRDGAAYVQWMTLRAQLAERGVKYD